ncbi:hypothetical protein TCAP_06730 [Tolypocladium capitatum]|uniref:Uncharacterized protein n=1 Tax=Tolypocladium capitatum TaxID=45235 RepID=A0A2K3Q6W7_9HYPO|nr:hypothetical protein TCAP_06730 [Tolypocladium capitatum]
MSSFKTATPHVLHDGGCLDTSGASKDANKDAKAGNVNVGTRLTAAKDAADDNMDQERGEPRGQG